MARRFSPRHTVHRIRETLAEMERAQRRMFEIRAGLPPASSLDRERDRAMIAELEAHWRM
ncbi:MAG: hypothetical protein ACXVR1_00920 [Solirubrobacteraceae bacterium]